ncbi:MAG: hypothetical protein KAR42_02420 [candidate division Zixibacteria bacterium]|nr:hypothetical protein [candidate division Zixibacteria bacterium]
MDWQIFGVWLAAFMTLGIISFLYKDNVFYKAAEAIFIGISAGYWFIVFFWDSMVGKFYVQAIESPEPEHHVWVGLILGILMLARLSNKVGWIARWPLAFVVGATAGLYMMMFFVSNAMVQVQSTIMPLWETGDGWFTVFNNIVIIIGVTCGLVYFFFSKKHEGAFGVAAKIGIWFLMVTFGASFGYTVMSRMSLMLGRLDFLFGTWLEMIP